MDGDVPVLPVTICAVPHGAELHHVHDGKRRTPNYECGRGSTLTLMMESLKLGLRVKAFKE